MDDQKAIELYTLFRESYQTPRIKEIMQKIDLSGGQAMGKAMLPFVESAADFLRELFNSINELRRWVNTLNAWNHVYEAADQEDRQSILIEHIRPFSTLVLNAPQSIRGRIMYAAATCCSHANHELYTDRAELQWDGGHVNMKKASAIGQPWGKWKELAPLLSEGGLGYGAIQDKTDGYRNEHEHGHPRNVGMGLTTAVKVYNENNGRVWEFGSREAIPPGTVIEIVAEQHALAVKAYQLLGELLKEQFEPLQRATHPLPWTLPNAGFRAPE